MPIPQQSHPPEDPPQDQESPPDTRGFIAINRDNLKAIRDAIRSKKGLKAQTKNNLELFVLRMTEEAQFIGPDYGTAHRTLQDWAEIFDVSYKTIVGWRDHLESINVKIEDAKGQIEMPLITTVYKGFQRGRHNRRAITTAEGQFKKPQRGNSGSVLKLNFYEGLTGRGGDRGAIRISPSGRLLKNTHPKELKSKAFNTSEGKTPNIGTEKMGTEVEEANGINQSELEFSGTSNSGIDSQATPKSGGLRNSNLSVSSISEAVAQLDRATSSGAIGRRFESSMSHKTAEISAVISSTSKSCDAIDIPDKPSGYGPEGPKPLGYEPNELEEGTQRIEQRIPNHFCFLREVTTRSLEHAETDTVAVNHCVSEENGAEEEADTSSTTGGQDPEGSQTPVYEPFTKEKLEEIAPDESRLSYSAMLGEIDRLVGFTLPWNDEKQIRAYYDALTGETIVGIVERHLEGIQGARKRCGYVLGLLKKYAAGELIEEDRDQKVTKTGLTGMMQRAPKKGQPIRAVRNRCAKQGRHNQIAYWTALERVGVEQVFQKDEKQIKAIANGGDAVGNTAVLCELRRMAEKGFKFETVDEALSKVKELMSDSETYDVPQSAIA